MIIGGRHSTNAQIGRRSASPKLLLAVGDPDVFDLGGVLEEEAAFGLACIEPIDLAPLVGEGLFEIADGKSLCGGAGGGVGEDPEGIEVVVFGERFEELGGTAGDDVHGAGRKVAGFENLVEVTGDERINFAGDGDDGVADGNGGHHCGDEAEKRSFGGAEDADGADGFLHGKSDVAEGRIVDGSVVFVGPGGVGEDTLDAGGEFRGGLLVANSTGEPSRDFFAALA